MTQLDLARYRLSMQPIPAFIELALARGVQAAEFPAVRAAAEVIDAWPEYRDQVRRAADGCLLVTCTTSMPGVSAAMIDWWFGWHLAATARYQLWHPQAHTWTRPREQREHLVDDRARYLGNVSYVNEYIGAHHKRLAIAFFPATELELDAAYQPGRTAICARTADRWLRSDGGHVVHWIEPVADTPSMGTGVEMRSIFWLGEISPHWALLNPFIRPLVNTAFMRRRIVTEQMGLDLLRHCAEEMNHLGRFLPALYRAVKGQDMPSKQMQEKATV